MMSVVPAFHRLTALPAGDCRFGPHRLQNSPKVARGGRDLCVRARGRNHSNFERDSTRPTKEFCAPYHDHLYTSREQRVSLPRPQTQKPSMAFQQSNPRRLADDDSDVEEEALANDYREQVQYEDGYGDEMDASSVGGGLQDLQAQLVAAAQPLEYGASLEAKIASYDSYCNLFHFILNSDGPVDIDVPSVSHQYRGTGNEGIL